jgi:uncharacterized protein (TIGR02271 family)
MTTQDQLRTLVGTTAYDQSGDKIGKIGAVYYDDNTDQPKWVTVHTGLFGTNETFVPIQGADFSGDRVTLAYEKAQVKDAPNISEDGHLTPQEEEQLYRYYGLGYDTGYGETHETGQAASFVAGSADTADRGRHAAGVGGAGYSELGTHERTRTDRDGDGVPDVAERAVGHDTSGPNTDSAMTRSEEQLRVGSETHEAGRVRLRKHVVTERQQVTVPVSREEVTLEREPITEANRGDAHDGPAISEEEHEVTLRAERPVVDVEAVPVERVRLGKETVTEQETVGGEVRKEEIDLDRGDAAAEGVRDEVRTDRR